MYKMHCGYVKHSFYNGNISSLTTTNMIMIAKEESSRDILCQKVSYNKGYIVYLYLNPIRLSSTIKVIDEPERIIRKNNICKYITSKNIPGVPQIDDDTFDTFISRTTPFELGNENSRNGILTINGTEKNVIIKYSTKEYNSFEEEVILHNELSENNLTPKIIGYRTCVQSIGVKAKHVLLIDDIENNLISEITQDIRKVFISLIEHIISLRELYNIVFYNLSLSNIVSGVEYIYVENVSMAIVYDKAEIDDAILAISQGTASNEQKSIIAQDFYDITRSILSFVGDNINEEFISFKKIIIDNNLQMPLGWHNIYVKYYLQHNKIMDTIDYINYIRYIFVYHDINKALFSVLSCPYEDYILDCMKERLSRDDVASISLDSGTPLLPKNLLWAHGTMSNGTRVTIRKIQSTILEPFVCLQDEAYRAKLSTKILSYWRCPPDSVIIMEKSNGLNALDEAMSHIDHIFEIYLHVIAKIYQLNWKIGIVVNDFIYVYLHQGGEADILGFSEKSLRNDITKIEESYESETRLNFDPFIDIREMTDYFLRLDSIETIHGTFIKKIKLYLNSSIDFMNIHKELYRKYNRIPDATEFVTELRNKIIPKDLASRLPPFSNTLNNPSGIFDIIGYRCNRDSDYLIECPGGIDSLSGEELSKVKIDINHISTGTQGVIYKGLYNMKPIILKYTLFQDDRIQNFTNEICNQNTAALNGISPRIFSYWKCHDENKGVIIMDYIQGDTFFNCMKKEANIVEIYLEVLASIMYLNLGLHISHKDLHTSNVIVTRNDVFIIDYGWSDVVNASEFKNILDKVAIASAHDPNTVKDVTDCHLFIFDLIDKIKDLKFKAYEMYNTVVYNQFNLGDRWVQIHQELYDKLKRKPTWLELYHIVAPCFYHLLSQREVIVFHCSNININTIPTVLNNKRYPMRMETLSNIKYVRLEKTLYCDYYYGHHNGSRITVAVSTDKRQFEMHALAAEKSLAPEILGFFICGRHYILAYRNVGNSIDKYDLSSNKNFYSFYLRVLEVYLRLNMELQITHGVALSYCVEFTEDKAFINKFPLARRYDRNQYIDDIKDRSRKPLVFGDPTTVAADFCMLTHIYRKNVQEIGDMCSAMKAKTNVMDIIYQYHDYHNKLPTARDVIESILRKNILE